MSAYRIVYAAVMWARAMRKYDKMRPDNFEDAERIIEEMPDAWRQLCEAESELLGAVEAFTEQQCRRCGTSFVPTRKGQSYCRLEDCVMARARERVKKHRSSRGVGACV